MIEPNKTLATMPQGYSIVVRKRLSDQQWIVTHNYSLGLRLGDMSGTDVETEMHVISEYGYIPGQLLQEGK